MVAKRASCAVTVPMASRPSPPDVRIFRVRNARKRGGVERPGLAWRERIAVKAPHARSPTRRRPGCPLSTPPVEREPGAGLDRAHFRTAPPICTPPIWGNPHNMQASAQLCKAMLPVRCERRRACGLWGAHCPLAAHPRARGGCPSGRSSRPLAGRRASGASSPQVRPAPASHRARPAPLALDWRGCSHPVASSRRPPPPPAQPCAACRAAPRRRLRARCWARVSWTRS